MDSSGIEIATAGERDGSRSLFVSFASIVKPPTFGRRFYYAPTGTRTPVLALRGLRPRPLDDGGKGTGGACLKLQCGVET